MKDEIINFNKKKLEQLPINSIYWNYKNPLEAIKIKTVKSTFHGTSQRIIREFYKTISPVNL